MKIAVWGVNATAVRTRSVRRLDAARPGSRVTQNCGLDGRARGRGARSNWSRRRPRQLRRDAHVDSTVRCSSSPASRAGRIPARIRVRRRQSRHAGIRTTSVSCDEEQVTVRVLLDEVTSTALGRDRISDGTAAPLRRRHLHGMRDEVAGDQGARSVDQSRTSVDLQEIDRVRSHDRLDLVLVFRTMPDALRQPMAVFGSLHGLRLLLRSLEQPASQRSLSRPSTSKAGRTASRSGGAFCCPAGRAAKPGWGIVAIDRAVGAGGRRRPAMGSRSLWPLVLWWAPSCSREIAWSSRRRCSSSQRQ